MFTGSAGYIHKVFCDDSQSFTPSNKYFCFICIFLYVKIYIFWKTNLYYHLPFQSTYFPSEELWDSSLFCTLMVSEIRNAYFRDSCLKFKSFSVWAPYLVKGKTSHLTDLIQSASTGNKCFQVVAVDSRKPKYFQSSLRNCFTQLTQDYTMCWISKKEVSPVSTII